MEVVAVDNLITKTVVVVVVVLVLVVTEAAAEELTKDVAPAITTTKVTRITTRTTHQIFCSRILLITDRTMVLLEGTMINQIKVTFSIPLNNNRNRMWQCNSRPTLNRETVILDVDSIITMRVNQILITLSR